MHPPLVRRPPLLVAVVAAVALEAGLLVGVAAFYLVLALGPDADEPGAAAATAALAALIGGFLILCARGLWRGRRWARGPVVTWQLLQLAVAVPALTGPGWPVGAVLVGASLLAGVGLLTPQVTRATASTADPPVS
jgi:hypothetical protein